MGKDCEPRIKIEHEELASGELKKKERNEFQTHGKNNIAVQSKEST